MVVRIASERMYLWRAVDHECEVLDMLARNRDRGLRFTNQCLKRRSTYSRIKL
jgi:transposase-like protein